jgi:excinuclease ABC subunit C
MNQYIKDKLSLLPLSPGCYLMKDKNNTVIYVGKAKKLKNRVSSYFTGVHNYKTTKLVSEIVDFEYIVTDSEKEALLLEINLIKDYSPKYNIMFMDNTYYPYIQLTEEKHPRLKIVRNVKEKKHKHFGPFPDAGAARTTFQLLGRLFPLRKCEHLPNKPCLYYSLNQCLAPCINDVNHEEYIQIKKDIIKFMKGDVKDKIDELEKKMYEASDKLAFEQAKEYRDLIESIKYVTAKQHVQFNDNTDRDILGYYVDKGYLSIQLFFMRSGKLLARDLNLIPISDEVEEHLQQFIVSFYNQNTYPKELLVPKEFDHTLLDDILECKIMTPQRGDKLQLVEMACSNAKESLEKKFSLVEKNRKSTIGAIEQLGELLNIDTPHTIELFDNSHIQGAYNVAGMVCYKDGVPSKKDYRKFKIKSVDGVDDYASMREVIYRRYYRLLVENQTLPDMIIVDGGIGQINAAKEVIESLNIPITICGLAKDDKHSTAMLLNDKGEKVEISAKSDLFFLLTRMQDEVHRYAISFHKNIRGKSMIASTLDNVEGIGPKRRKDLLNHFKSMKKIKEATVEQLEEVLPKKVALELYETLHSSE